MEESDTEDVIFEGSQLAEHLKSSGYSGPEIDYYSPPKEEELQSADRRQGWKITSLPTRLFSALSFQHPNQDKGLSIEISKLVLACNLLTIEDSDFLHNISEDDSALEPAPSAEDDDRPTYVAVTTVGGLVLGLLLMSTPGVPPFLRLPSLIFTGVNIFCAVRKQVEVRRVRRIASVVDEFRRSLELWHSLCSVLVKSIQFVQEMELIERGFTLPNLVSHLSFRTRPDSASALLCPSLRRELLTATEELHGMARNETLRIRQLLPLPRAMDSVGHYLACAPRLMPGLEPEDHLISLQQIRASMRNCKQQVSEMLRRLVLPLLLTENAGGAPRRLRPVLDTFVGGTRHRLLTLTDRVRAALDYHAAWRVRDDPPRSEGRADRLQSEGLRVALHGLERHLCAAALVADRLRRHSADDSVEDDGDDDQLFTASGEVEERLRQRLLLTKLTDECRAITTCCQLVDAEWLRSNTQVVAAALAPASVPPPPLDGTEMPVETPRQPLPLYGHWEAEVRDLEILEADLRLERALEKEPDAESDDGWAIEQSSAAERKERKERSRRLYGELQTVLKSRADRWREREADELRRLGRPPRLEDPETEKSGSEAPEEADPHEEEPPTVVRRPAAATFDAERAALAAGASSFSARAALAAQVRALAAQRSLARPDDIFAADGSSCSSSADSDGDECVDTP